MSTDDFLRQMAYLTSKRRLELAKYKNASGRIASYDEWVKAVWNESLLEINEKILAIVAPFESEEMS